MSDITKSNKYSALSPFERSAQNKFSFWYPKIKDCGIPVPKSLIFDVPLQGNESLSEHFYMQRPQEDLAAIQAWVSRTVLPKLKEEKMSPLLFIKNSVFSNKFDASTCLIMAEQLPWALANINLAAACVDADGWEELVVRERIHYNRSFTPCIYNGLPLRPEFRVFFDFTKGSPIFTANYWDWDYVYPHLFDATDKCVFMHEREHLTTMFNAYKDEAAAIVFEHMKNVEGLEGSWSIDVLLDERKQWWLIDMAVAEQSAYWELRPGNEKNLAAEKEKEAERREKMHALTTEIVTSDHTNSTCVLLEPTGMHCIIGKSIPEDGEVYTCIDPKN